VLIVAGSKDEHTTLEESRELFAAASMPKSLWVVEGARHQDLLAFDGAGYEEHVVGFLSAALAPSLLRGRRNGFKSVLAENPEGELESRLLTRGCRASMGISERPGQRYHDSIRIVEASLG
jgi:hypothetical protein